MGTTSTTLLSVARPAGAARPASSALSSAPPRLTRQEVDALRVRALRGDALREVRDATREWVLRSLLLGKRREEWATLAGITDDAAYARAVARVAGWYQQRLDAYKRHPRPPRPPQTPRIRKPVALPPPPPSPVPPVQEPRGWWSVVGSIVRRGG